MYSSKLLLSSATAAIFYSTLVTSQTKFPEISGTSVCDGIIRPTWSDCEDILKQLTGNIAAGPGYLVGTSFSYGNCKINFLNCDADAPNAGFTSDASIVRGLANAVKDSCGEGVGGIFRQGQACVSVEDPENHFRKRGVSRIEGRREMERQNAVVVPKKQKRLKNIVARNSVKVSDALRSESQAGYLKRRKLLNRQCENSDTVLGSTCYTYEESIFLQHVRGAEVKVCDNVLPDGASCTQTKSHTVTQGLDVGFEYGAELFGVVSLGGSFTQTSSTSNTETLATQITINCKDGSKQGYVVWYPYFEVSRGDCGKGKIGTCSGICYVSNEEKTSCEMRMPVRSGFGQLTGEYGVKCI